MTSKVTGTLGGLPVEGDPASDTLEVSAAFLPPGFSKSFAPYLIDTGETSSLTFTINNTSNTEREATNLGFTDNLPAGVIVAPAPNASTTCRGGTVTATPGTGVNGHMIGNVTYNVNRADVTACFPGFNNSGSPGGYFVLDTTQYDNGVHTIAWSVTDDAGNIDGIGSRYFTISNTN